MLLVGVKEEWYLLSVFTQIGDETKRQEVNLEIQGVVGMACVLGNAVLDPCKDCSMPLTSP